MESIKAGIEARIAREFPNGIASEVEVEVEGEDE
jgi:hypothetical protein